MATRILKANLCLSASVIFGCLGSDKLEGDAHADSETVDAPDVDAFEIPPSWDCVQDTDCDDGDSCTWDTCNMTSHLCEYERWTGFGFLGRDVQITHDPHYSELGVMIWTGSALGLAWSDGRDGGCSGPPGPLHCNKEVYFKIVDALGVEISSEARLSHTDATSNPLTGIWTGSEFAVGWEERMPGLGDYYVEFTIVGESGVPLGREIIPSAGHGGRTLSIEWTGSEYAVVWNQGGVLTDPSIDWSLRFTRFDPLGTELADVVLVDDWCLPRNPTLICTGEEFGLLQYKDSAHWFYKLDITGGILHEPVPVVDGDNTEEAMMVWTGSVFGAAWSLTHPGYDSDRLAVSFAPLTPEGERIGTPIVISEPGARSLVNDIIWTGSEFGLSWTQVSSTGNEYFLTRLDPEGARIGDDLALPEASLIEWTGSEYIAGWSDDHDGTWQVYMNRIGFCE